MPLTTHLADRTSPVRSFIIDRFPGISAITGPVNTHLRTVGCACPPPSLGDTRYPYADVGKAIDYRLRYFYPATSTQELAGWRGGQLLFAHSPPEYMLGDLAAPHAVEGEVIFAFFDELDAFLARVQPAGRLLAPAEEAVLARYCFVLSLFETRYRSGVIADALILPGDQQSVEGLLAIAPDAVIGDIVAMATLFFTHFQDLVQKPVILNPAFAGSHDMGGADADLIIDGTLVEIKTTKNTALEPDWVRQLVGYWLLDYSNEFHINAIGFYLPRHGVLATWSVEEFLTTLTRQAVPIDWAALRADFRAVAETVRPPERPRLDLLPPEVRMKMAEERHKEQQREKRREAQRLRRAAIVAAKEPKP